MNKNKGILSQATAVWLLDAQYKAPNLQNVVIHSEEISLMTSSCSADK